MFAVRKMGVDHTSSFVQPPVSPQKLDSSLIVNLKLLSCWTDFMF